MDPINKELALKLIFNREETLNKHIGIISEAIDNGSNYENLIDDYFEIIQTISKQITISDVIPLYLLHIRKNMNTDKILGLLDDKRFLTSYIYKVGKEVLDGTTTLDFFVKGLDDLIPREGQIDIVYFGVLFPFPFNKPKHHGRDTRLNLSVYKNVKQKRLPLPEEDLLFILERYEKYMIIKYKIVTGLWQTVKFKQFKVLDFYQKHSCLFNAYSFHNPKFNLLEYVPQNLLNDQFENYVRAVKKHDGEFYKIEKYLIPKPEIYDIVTKFLDCGARFENVFESSIALEIQKCVQTMIENRIKRVE